MPAFQGLVSEDNLVALVEYVKSLSPTATTTRTAPCGGASRAPESTFVGWEKLSHARYAQAARTSLPEHHPRPQVVAVDEGPQADRDHVPGLDLGDVLPRRPLRRRRPARAGDAAGRLRHRRHLQQALHHARRDHGVLLPDPVDSGGARQLPDPADDRRQGPGVSAHQPDQPLHLLDRRHLHALRHDRRRRRYRLDLLRARTAPPSRAPTSCRRRWASSSPASRRS